METGMRHGGQILVDQLKLRGVKRVFSVPGESFLAALDGLCDSGIENIVCRHEGGASMMAEAMGKMTGQPGVLFVTRGPGASNAAAGLHVAMQDSTPMIAFVGQVPRIHRDREAFQEVDYSAFFGGFVKWVGEVRETERLPEYISRAYQVATSGRPGPVVLSLPEDMLSACAQTADIRPPGPVYKPDHDVFAQDVLKLCAQAQRPLVILGGSQWSAEAARDAERFAQAADVPILTTFRRQDYIDNRHPNFAGDLGVGMDPKLKDKVSQADLLIVIGTRLGETATQSYELLSPNQPHARGRMIHIHSDPGELRRVHAAEVVYTATAPDMLAALARQAEALPATPHLRPWTQTARTDFLAWKAPAESPGELKQEEVISWLSETLPEDTILTNGAGNYAAWLHRYFHYKAHGTQLAPTSGSMGYGLPAAISAKLEHRDKTVICFAGDGCLQMTINELSTAAQYGVGIIVIVINNGRYGTIRMHQEHHFPGRVSGTDLFLPDMPLLAQSYGGTGETVTETSAFPAAFERAKETSEAGKIAIIELVVDTQALSTGQTLDAARRLGESRQDTRGS